MNLLIFRRLDNRARPSNHIVQRRAGRDHRIDSIFLLNFKIDQHRPIIIVLSGDHIYKMNYGKMLQQHVDAGADCTVGTTCDRSETVALRMP